MAGDRSAVGGVDGVQKHGKDVCCVSLRWSQMFYGNV